MPFRVNSTHPGSDVVASASAALSSASLVFQNHDPVYSTTLLKHAKELYSFGKQYQGFYNDALPDQALFYKSTSYFDDLAWAAVWLYKATKDDAYLTESIAFANLGCGNSYYHMDWNTVCPGVELIQKQLGVTSRSTFLEPFFESWLYSPLSKNGFVERNTPFVLREVSTVGFLTQIALKNKILSSDLAPKMLCWTMDRVRGILGETGRSWIVGYGKNPPKNAHHKAASCGALTLPCGWNEFYSNATNPVTIEGALIGGGSEDFLDDRKNASMTEVTLDINAGYTGLVASIVESGDRFLVCQRGTIQHLIHSIVH